MLSTTSHASHNSIVTVLEEQANNDGIDTQADSRRVLIAPADTFQSVTSTPWPAVSFAIAIT